MLSDDILQLGQHEYDWEYWEQTDKEILSGHWIIEIEENKPARLYSNDAILMRLGFPIDKDPETYYTMWQENIFSSHIAEM